MANFTQLHLGNKSQETSHKDQKQKELSRQKVLFGSGLLAVTVLSECSWSSPMAVRKGPRRSQARIPRIKMLPISHPRPILPTPVVTPAVETPAEKPARKHVVQTKAPSATFSDPINGVSFHYPKSYVLKRGREASLDLAGLGPLQMDFVQPGGMTVAAIELPRNSYPGTDFNAAFFSVSVNPELSASQCEAVLVPAEPASGERAWFAGQGNHRGHGIQHGRRLWRDRQERTSHEVLPPLRKRNLL